MQEVIMAISVDKRSTPAPAAGEYPHARFPHAAPPPATVHTPSGR